MAKQRFSTHTRTSSVRRGQQRKREHARVTALEAQVASLKAQLAAARSVQAASPGARLNTLLAISAALLTTYDLNAVLRLAVQESVHLFPGTIGALLFLSTADEQLVLRAASTGQVPNLMVQPGQGVAGRAYLAPRAMLLVGPELELVLSELNEQQLGALHEILTPWPPTSALLAPLRFEGQRMGALIFYGGEHAHLFHPRDLAFVQALADLVAVAIAETRQRERNAALQHDLYQTRSLHADAQARLDAAQAQLLQSAKLAAVGELSASVAHEINNPLYAARNSLFLIEQDLPQDSPHRPFLGIAQTELGRIARIITRMRDFYRPSRSELEPVNINHLLEETVELVQTHLRHGHVTVMADLSADSPSLVAHADQLRQVFLNLMLNACDAMPAGGTLHVTTQSLPGADTGSGLVVQIADTGTGIPPEHLERIFEPFYTTKPQGTGLGLAISAHIITQHGGTIAVDSTPSQGTVFTITLHM